jgi:hypothetical protein
MKAIWVLAFTLVAQTAFAQARHEQVSVFPIKKGGRVIGARLKLSLRPDRGWNSGYTLARVGLARADAKAKDGSPIDWKALNDFTGSMRDSKWRQLSSDPTQGFLIHQFQQETGLTDRTQRTYTILYGQGPFQGGEELRVISAWDSPAPDWEGLRPYTHIYGMQPYKPSEAIIIKLPLPKDNSPLAPAIPPAATTSP